MKLKLLSSIMVLVGMFGTGLTLNDMSVDDYCEPADCTVEEEHTHSYCAVEGCTIEGEHTHNRSGRHHGSEHGGGHH